MLTDGFSSMDQQPDSPLSLSWIKQNADDFIWIEDHIDQISQTVETAVQKLDQYFLMVDTLMALVATALIYETSEPWLKRVTDIGLKHPAEPLNPFQNAFQDALRQFQPLAGVFGKRDQQSHEQTDRLLQAYTLLLKTLDFNRGMLVNETLLEQANKLASDKPGERLYSEYHQALALYYAHRGEVFLGIRMGKIAFSQYENNEDAPGSADAACTLAILYRITDEQVTAKYYLDLALKRAKQEGVRNKKLATMIYEQGSIAFKNENFASALHYWREALEIFVEFDALYQIAMTHQAIALGYYEMYKLDETEPEIAAARDIWGKIGNRYELAALQMIEGQVELRRENRTLALRQMNRALELARQLPESPARDAMIDKMNAFINTHYPPYTPPPNLLSLFGS